jgi:hypothetical protein
MGSVFSLPDGKKGIPVHVSLVLKAIKNKTVSSALTKIFKKPRSK